MEQLFKKKKNNNLLRVFFSFKEKALYSGRVSLKSHEATLLLAPNGQGYIFESLQASASLLVKMTGL